MPSRWNRIVAAFVAASVVNLAGVLLLLNPVAERDTTDGPLVPAAVGFFVYVVLTVALFDWTARHMHSAYKAAFVVGASQFILVNVDFVLSGKRGLLTAAASTILIAATWSAVGFAYSRFSADADTPGVSP